MDYILTYLQDTVGLSGIIEQTTDDILKKLPLYMRNAYKYSLFKIDGYSFLLVEEIKKNKEISRTAGELKRQAKEFFQHTGLSPVFVLTNQSPQMRRNMIKDRINFVVPENQIYLPDMLISLKENNHRYYRLSEQLTPSAQLLLLYHLQVERLEGYSFKEIAKKIGYSPKTITKVAEELKEKQLCLIIGTKEKKFVFEKNDKQLWLMAEPQMQSPIIKTYFTSTDTDERFCKSGDMALAHYTFLADTGKKSYALYKSEFEELKAAGYWKYLDEIEGDFQIEVWKYNPALLNNNGYIDPLSLYLCYREDRNERVEAEIKNLITDKVWSEE
ncbi:hypothetical protein [Proteiniphilum sp.]|uniref:hypothetical protein n=1 Tax=Proteiniphilum sp. TaxID=1926877 RepID=UPI002B1F3A03|nr:hypothetical protein [Proteiniphilum sp.]MEA4917228.1 hypothetical protein [Proteiniphilum sp.]